MALPVAMADTGFDAFKLLPDDPTTLSGIQQKSLSALLLAATGSSSSLPSEEYGWISGGAAGFGSAYRNFKQLLMFMLISEGKDVNDAVYEVVHRVMGSTGAFESNPMEISLWLDLLVLWKIDKPASAYASLVDFLSGAVSSMGQNSYKYLDSLHSILSDYVLLEDADNSDLRSGELEGKLTFTLFSGLVVFHFQDGDIFFFKTKTLRLPSPNIVHKHILGCILSFLTQLRYWQVLVLQSSGRLLFALWKSSCKLFPKANYQLVHVQLLHSIWSMSWTVC